MNRRAFLKLSAAGATVLASRPAARAALPKMKITRIRYYDSPLSRAMFNQSQSIVTVETDQGITGIGEGGSRDLVRDCADVLIGEDPTRIDRCWQMMFRGKFYPAGREKLDAMGAIDMALWDIKGKGLGVPVYELLGGRSHDHLECYSTAFPSKGTLKESAQACIEAGFRAYRTSVAEPAQGGTFNSRQMVQKTFDNCREIREGVGKTGDWAIDYHTRLDMADAVRLSSLIEPLEPYFCEDLVRSEDSSLYRTLRQQVKVPIAVGEQFGARWDTAELIERNLIDYSRTSLPNVGGISEYMKIAALCETHSVGLIPHFTGPVSEAALVHVCAAFPGPVMMEMLGTGPREIAYLPQHYDFRKGKMWPNDRPGLGVTFDASKLPMTAEFTERRLPSPMFQRPDGSFTNW